VRLTQLRARGRAPHTDQPLPGMSARPGTMRLREAVERGDGDAVQRELDAGVPVDAAGRTRWTPLHRAVDRGHVHIVRMLCAANANPNVRTETGGDTPLHIAAAKGDSASVAELLRVGADPRLKAKNGECSCARARARARAEALARLRVRLRVRVRVCGAFSAQQSLPSRTDCGVA
jgi:ankyrin repeat protein